MAEIGVVYLYRFSEGELPVRTFLDTYRAHPAGVDHDLHVVCKGFPDRDSVAAAQRLFRGLPINPIELDDRGFDIGTYFAAAQAVANRRLIFFNTFSEILADDWLKKFDDALSLPGVGLVGATGSWQSHCSGYEAIAKQVRYRLRHPMEYVGELLDDLHCAQKIAGTTGGGSANAQERRKIRQIARALYHLIRLDRYAYYRLEYFRYPNPHIRTNAFMIERERFLALRMPPFRRKSDAYKFESGRLSLTRQIMAQNLRPVVVDRTGSVYDISEWKSSSTYWTGQQSNLIVADNRTRDYSDGDQERRTRLEDNAWIPPASWQIKGRRLPASR